MLNPLVTTPLYVQLKQRLKQKMLAGQWQAHELVPSERSLIEEYGVSRTTVRQALTELVSEGLLYRRHGKGTFLAAAPLKPTARSPLIGYVEELLERGLSPEICVGRVVVAEAPAAVSTALELADGQPAQAVHRLILLAGAPLVKIEAWFPLSLDLRFSEEDLRAGPLRRLLKSQGVLPVHGRQSVRAVCASPFETDLLGLPEPSLALEVVRTLYSGRNHPLEWSRALYHPDRYEYLVELRSQAETS